jgi:hypothetical protein
MKLKGALRWSEKGQSIRLRAMAKIASSSAGGLQRKCDDPEAMIIGPFANDMLEPLSHE